MGPSARRNYRGALADARAYLKEREISPASLVDYRRHLQARGLAGTTINAYLAAVKLFCSAHYDPSPAHGVRITRPDRHARRALSREQAAAILALPGKTAQDARDRAILALALICGLRAAEVSRLQRSDYTWEGGRRVLTVHGKGRHDANQVAVVPPPLAAILKTWLFVRPVSTWLFCATVPAYLGRRLSTRSISKIGRRALDAIGLDDPAYTFHSLRHTAACLLLEHGGDYARTQELLRHASIDTTRIYTHTVARRRRIEDPQEADLCRLLLEESHDRP